MITQVERQILKEQALLCCNIYITEGQSALEKKLSTYNFADRLIIELLTQVYIDVKQMHISYDEGRYRQNSILGVCEIEGMEE